MDSSAMDLTLMDASLVSRTSDTPSPPPPPPPSDDVEMKDVSFAASRSSRNVVYPRQRPFPAGGVSKSRGRADPCPAPTRRVSVTAKAEQLARKQRQAQIDRLHKQGIYLEEEYREEICAYMHDMEVGV
jgi:hypothetical protein